MGASPKTASVKTGLTLYIYIALIEYADTLYEGGSESSVISVITLLIDMIG